MADKVFLTDHTKTGAGVDFRTQIFKFIKRIGFVKESVCFSPPGECNTHACQSV